MIEARGEFDFELSRPQLEPEYQFYSIAASRLYVQTGTIIREQRIEAAQIQEEHEGSFICNGCFEGRKLSGNHPRLKLLFDGSPLNLTLEPERVCFRGICRLEDLVDRLRRLAPEIQEVDGELRCEKVQYDYVQYDPLLVIFTISDGKLYHEMGHIARSQKTPAHAE